MRAVLLGTPSFAVPALQMLLDHSYDVCGVFTQPDRPSGRGQKLQPSPVKILAQARGIQVFQPEKIRKEENRAIIEALQPDFVVSAAYGQIIPGWLLRSARIAPVNIHASLLPRYRGAAPIAWAILNGDAVTGVTIMRMEETLDTGPILLQQEVPIPLTITTGELSSELSTIGAKLLIQALDELRKSTITPLVQDESKVTWAPRVTKEMGQIIWEKRAPDIHNQIRAMNPWPVAYTAFRGERLHVWRSIPANRISNSSAAPRTFLGLTQEGISVQCGEGTILELLEVQRPGKSRVSGRDFASGARLHVGEPIFS